MIIVYEMFTSFALTIRLCVLGVFGKQRRLGDTVINLLTFELQFLYAGWMIRVVFLTLIFATQNTEYLVSNNRIQIPNMSNFSIQL